MKFISTFLLPGLFLFSAFFANSQNNPRNIVLDWKTDTLQQLVPLSEFTALLIRDGIPPIDTPIYWTKEVALKNLFLHEPVISFIVHGQARAYPLSILMFHEIVNDRIDDTYFTVTYCPLCNAAIVFDRKLKYNGKDYLLDFGVSGMLRNSDLVMWDRQTESWWQQFTGTGLVGAMAGAELDFLSSQLISLQEFTDSYPDGLILSTETGHDNKYGQNPYTTYDNPENKQPRLFKGEVDTRLPAMERVIDIQVEGKRKIYPLTTIQKDEVINDRFEGKDIALFYASKTVSVLDKKEIAASKAVGSVTVFSPIIDNKLLTFIKKEDHFYDQQTQSKWTITGICVEGKHKGIQLTPIVYGNHFAFAWFAFHPDSEIYK
ncbi:MAG: DUF3179 domain-containing protein [Saprospiraceae bacterium]